MAFGNGGANTQQFRYIWQEPMPAATSEPVTQPNTGRTKRRLGICFQIVYSVLLCEA